MSSRTDELYKLLPAYYRVRDHEEGQRLKALIEELAGESEEGGPLKALIEVLARESGVVEADIAQLYENWFIETCEEWVVPYIGDLLGARGVHSIIDAAVFSQRAYVANTLSYRRRKGTAPILEQLALDITGWRCHVVEFFDLLGATQNVNHIRPHNLITTDLRCMNDLDLMDTAFDPSAHTVDVRRIATGLGRYNIPNIGLFLWRLQSYPMTKSVAREITLSPPKEGCFTFSPLGLDCQLLNRPQTETEIMHLAEETNVPGLLRRRALYDELEERRQVVLVDQKTPRYDYFDDREDSENPPVVKVFVNDEEDPVPPEEIVICNLADWNPPVEEKTYEGLKPDGTFGEVTQSIRVAIDPVLGRLTFTDPEGIENVHVNYAYGFGGDVGGGPYDRHESVSDTLARDITWQVGVSKEKEPVAGESIFDNLVDAVAEWNDQPEGSVGMITMMDNHTYDDSLTGTERINIPDGSQLLIVAADWPVRESGNGSSGSKMRVIGEWKAEELRPHLHGNLEVEGTAAAGSITGGELVLNGLLVEGSLTVENGNLGSLQICHCTLVPGHKGLETKPENERLQVVLKRSICGPILLTSESCSLLVDECIVDNGSGLAISSDKTPVELQRTTVFGRVEAIKIEASNCIFEDKVYIERRQTGCIRFSYVPDSSETPRRFRCQPDLEIETQTSEAEEKNGLDDSDRQAIRKRILEWLIPIFTSSEYGHHAYGQLGRACSCLIKTGAEDSSEMGVFNYLKQPQREVNLQTAMDEYLRLGLEAGIIYVT